MQRFPTRGYKWLRNSIPKYSGTMDSVYRRIQEEGPLASRDFKDPDHRSGGWWNWKPAKIALDLLWWMGKIAVVNRFGFERVYDVVERAIPSKYLNQTVDISEVWRHFIKKAIDCLAVATISDIKNYFAFHIYALDKTQSEKTTLAEKVSILRNEDIAVEVDVQGDSEPHYSLSSNLSRLEKAKEQSAQRDHAWFLSPFDNALWDRKRVRRLFDVEVKLEAYVPQAKRKFGYYEMPILWNDRIIGRLDPKAVRKTKTLILENFEVTTTRNERRDASKAIRAELQRFQAFHGCESVKFSSRIRDPSLLVL
jgi:uncharacterized protein YcaQ